MDFGSQYALVLREIGVPGPFDLGVFCGNVARARGRRVELHELPGGLDGVCGLYVSLPVVDHVFFAAGTSLGHREHIIVHELMHLVFEHGGLRGPSAEVLARLLPGLDPGLVRAALGRGGYSDPEEREAEMVASLVLERAGRGAGGVGDDPVAARIEAAFG